MEGEVYRKRETVLLDTQYNEVSQYFIVQVKGRMPVSSEGWKRQTEI